MTIYSFPSISTDGLTLILGLGETGVASALWCAQHGARLRVLDTREQPAGLQALKTELDTVEVDYRLGVAEFTAEALEGVQRIVISPGLAPNQEPVKSLLAQAEQRGIDVVGEIELFAQALADMAPQGYAPRVLAITGTNGKTTVTAMTRQIIQAGGLMVRAAGNIGPAALVALRQALNDNELPEVWVLELSSFQMETTSSLKPDAATVLNLTQDHLDWHGSMQAYGAAKAKLLGAAALAIVNRDNASVMRMVADERSMAVRTFGRDTPNWVGDLGVESSHGVSWLTVSEASDFDLPPTSARRRKQAVDPQREAGRLSRLMPVDALRVRGAHNAANAMAAMALSRALGLGWAVMLRALRDYGGEPDRTEFVRSIGGVDFVNDSKGTNVGATVAALEGLGQKVVLIAGGVGKGQDFSPLARVVKQYATAVVLIGQDAPLIEAALRGSDVPVETLPTLDLAVARGFALAKSGEAVLLSPACASLDMFRNYHERGQAFVDAVQTLALDHGEMA